jgi:hypothetical protein
VISHDRVSDQAARFSPSSFGEVLALEELAFVSYWDDDTQFFLAERPTFPAFVHSASDPFAALIGVFSEIRERVIQDVEAGQPERFQRSVDATRSMPFERAGRC